MELEIILFKKNANDSLVQPIGPGQTDDMHSV